MTSLYYPPLFASGIAGAKLTFTATGTTTPQNTYSDESLATPNANPVVADANGLFGAIYLDPRLPSYRVKYTTSADVLIYQVDGYPSNQNIQQAIRLEATNPYLFLYDTDGSVNLRKYRIRAAGGAFEVQASNDAESVFTTILRYEGNILYSNETEVAVVSYGSYTGTLTGVSGTVTGTVSYRRVSNVVTLFLGGDLTGTSNATGMTLTGMPAAIRPSIARGVGCTDITDNGNTLCHTRAVVATDGVISFYIARTDTTANFVRYSATGFTNSGTKGPTTAWTITYPMA